MGTKILQLSDLHLCGNPTTRLKGIPTQQTLLNVLSFIKSGMFEFAHLIVTGDLAHDESFSAYERLRLMLADWTIECHLLPGNHDDRFQIKRAFADLFAPETEFLTFSFEVNGWRLIGLDSLASGEVFGDVDPRQLAWLREELSKHAAQPTILFIHHPPFPVRSAWLDRIGLQSPDELLSVIQSSPQIRAVSAGHVHQEFQDQMGDTLLLTTPSTSVQFRPYESEPVYDAIPSGFRVFNLDTDTFQSEVIRLPDVQYLPSAD